MVLYGTWCDFSEYTGFNRIKKYININTWNEISKRRMERN